MAPAPPRGARAPREAARRPGGLRRSSNGSVKSVSFSDVEESEPSHSEADSLSGIALEDIREAVPGAIESEECEVVPLLKVYTTTSRAPGGHFQVQMRRASLEQAFGVSFIATSDRDRLSSVTIATDALHLGLCRSDRLVTINGIRPHSANECAGILKTSFTVALVLERQRHWSSVENSQLPDCGSAPRLLLHSTVPQVLNAENGTFKLSLVRASLHQPFGMDFTTRPGARGRSRVAIELAADLPHLGLLAGDQLLMINQSKATDGCSCQRILQNSRDITLVMRRHPSKLNRLVPQVRSIDDEDWLYEDVSVKAVHVSEHQGCVHTVCCRQIL